MGTIEEAAFMTRAEVEEILRKRREKPSNSIIGIDPKPPYPTEIAIKSYPAGYIVP